MIKEIKFTDNALKQINNLLSSKDVGSIFRIAIKGGGCSGFQYEFSFDKNASSNDQKDGNILIDKTSADLLKGSEIDYEVMSPFKVTVAVVDESLSPEQKLTREFQLVSNNKDESTLFPPKADIGETLLTVDPRGNAYADGELIRINEKPTSKMTAIGQLDQGAPWEFLDAEIDTRTNTH